MVEPKGIKLNNVLEKIYIVYIGKTIKLCTYYEEEAHDYAVKKILKGYMPLIVFTKRDNNS